MIVWILLLEIVARQPTTTQEGFCIITVGSRNAIHVGETHQCLKEGQHIKVWHYLNVCGSDTKTSENGQIHFQLLITLLNPKGAQYSQLPYI